MNDLTTWLNIEVYPRLNHKMVFGELKDFKQKGNSFWAYCPVHEETNPSFYMRKGQPFGHCFGCGRTISWYSAVEKKVGTDRVIDELAKMAGVQSISKRDGAIHNWWENATKAIWNNTAILTYLQTRGYSNEQIRKMDIGTFPGTPSPIKVMLPPKEYPILLPVYRNGKLLGCVGRTIDDRKPKYMYPYGLSVSQYLLGVKRLDIHKPLYVVEGLLDSGLLNSYGIQAAAIGTSTPSQKQIEYLKTFSELVLALDADDAGHSGTTKAICRLHGIKTFVLNDFDGCKDPDEFIRAKGISKFKDKTTEAVPASVWYVKQISLNFESLPAVQQDRVLEEAMEYIHSLHSHFDQYRSIEALAKAISVPCETLKNEFEQIQKLKQEEATRQQIEEQIQQARELCKKNDFQQLNAVAKKISDLTTPKLGPTPVTYEALIKNFLDRPEEIEFPWRELNKLAKMLPGTITTLIGGTSHGKTSVATALALCCLAKKKRVVYWSGEIPADFIVQKMTAYLAGYDLATVSREQRKYFQDEATLPQVLNASEVMKTYSKILYIPETKNFVDVEHLINYCRQADADVLIIDYIQQLRPGTIGKKYRTKDEEIECVLQQLNFWVTEDKKYIIALGQMNREAKNVLQPEVCYARHSATIEHYSSLLLGIWNSAMAGIEPCNAGGIPAEGWYWRQKTQEQQKAIQYAIDQGKTMLELSILKNRYYGNVNKAVPLLFSGETGMIEDFPISTFSTLGKVVTI